MSKVARDHRVNELVSIRRLLESGVLKPEGHDGATRARVSDTKPSTSSLPTTCVYDSSAPVSWRWWDPVFDPMPDLFDLPGAEKGFLWDSGAAADVVPRKFADEHPDYVHQLP